MSTEPLTHEEIIRARAVVMMDSQTEGMTVAVARAIRAAEKRGREAALDAVENACECDTCYGVSPAKCGTFAAVSVVRGGKPA